MAINGTEVEPLYEGTTAMMYFTVIPSIVSAVFSLFSILICFINTANRTLYGCRITAFIGFWNIMLCITVVFSPEGDNWILTENPNGEILSECLVQSVATIFAENAQFMWVLMLIHTQRQVLVHNDKRPELNGGMYWTNVVLFPTLLCMIGIGRHRYESAFGWSENGRCKWDTKNGGLHGMRGGITSQIELFLQAMLAFVITWWCRSIVLYMYDKRDLCLDPHSKLAIEEKVKRHWRFIAIGMLLVVSKIPGFIVALGEFCVYVVTGIQGEPQWWDYPPSLVVFDQLSAQAHAVATFAVLFIYDAPTIIHSVGKFARHRFRDMARCFYCCCEGHSSDNEANEGKEKHKHSDECYRWCCLNFLNMHFDSSRDNAIPDAYKADAKKWLAAQYSHMDDSHEDSQGLLVDELQGRVDQYAVFDDDGWDASLGGNGTNTTGDTPGVPMATFGT